MNTIIGELGNSQKFVTLVNQIKKENGPIAISGLTDVGKTQILSGINKFAEMPICLITYNEIQAKKIYDDLKYFIDNVEFFPKKDIVTYDYIAESKELPYQRIETLNKLYQNKNIILVTTIEAVMQKLPAKEVLYKNVLNFKVGNTYDLEELKQQLINMGYARYDLIEGKGQFSIRGGIVDISTDENSGIRIEFWGDEVDSIRNFNISSQRSTSTLQKAIIYPAHEYVLEDTIDEVCKKIEEKIYNEKQQEILENDIEVIKNGDYISKIDKYFDDFYNDKTNILGYLDNDCLICIDEENKVNIRAENIKNDNKNLVQSLIEKDKIVPQAIENMYDFSEIDEKIQNKKILYIEEQDFIQKQAEKYKFEYRQVNYFNSEIEILLNEVKKAKEKNKKVYILTSTEEKSKKISKLLSENEIQNIYEKSIDKKIITEKLESILVTVGKLSTGFENYELNQLVIVADDLVQGEKKKRKKATSVFKEGEKVVFADLEVGDYVVHRHHGIGMFVGVNTITSDKVTKDYIKIKYKGNDILYVPTNQLDSIRKYIGGGEKEPKINKFGGKDWENTKTKVKNNLREVAKELIELYAKREKAKGFAFSPDTTWQKQFEDSFPYVETDDQLRCIEEVKKDMEKDKPMDRLLCGDVGYGKTEVAIRAAFKAVMDGKQVAYLVPTTVLADQQYQGFKERMKDFPIKVELLNRFKTAKEQNETIKKLKLGEVDVVIGTHRLLSKDVEFKDLGLLIIDEEHRFGVKDKEKIKQYKTNVDVLTMTATPIPRTLHMSIVGVRDMSVIYEPPQNRKPVQTYVLECDKEVIKEAITREIERNGQVFYIFNNIENIIKKVEEISELVPEARVSFAHGRMTGKEIEDIMQEFVDGKTDVLVCTTILESGIDIPNANTIIVENADRMGLAQLYQIRGRVGRSNKQAYAYITYKRDKILNEDADKRLKAIKEFTEFGSGFKIAMRDLEIRGAGSLLGEIQHGHLDQVGYDTYCELLDQVVKEMQGKKVEEVQELQIELNITSYIPEEYISDKKQKIEIYQDIALCKTEEDIQDIIDEIIDRFGNMPKEVENLIEIARIKMLCQNTDIIKIASKINGVVFNFEQSNFDVNVNELVKKYQDRIRFSPGIKPALTLKTNGKTDKEVLEELKEFIKDIKNSINK